MYAFQKPTYEVFTLYTLWIDLGSSNRKSFKISLRGFLYYGDIFRKKNQPEVFKEVVSNFPVLI